MRNEFNVYNSYQAFFITIRAIFVEMAANQVLLGFCFKWGWLHMVTHLLRVVLTSPGDIVLDTDFAFPRYAQPCAGSSTHGFNVHALINSNLSSPTYS